MLTMALRGYAWLICRLLWVVLWFARPFRSGPEPLTFGQVRDYQWSGLHYCTSCKTRDGHTFIEWMPERVTTAECGGCGHIETLT